LWYLQAYNAAQGTTFASIKLKNEESAAKDFWICQCGHSAKRTLEGIPLCDGAHKRVVKVPAASPAAVETPVATAETTKPAAPTAAPTATASSSAASPSHGKVPEWGWTIVAAAAAVAVIALAVAGYRRHCRK